MCGHVTTAPPPSWVPRSVPVPGANAVRAPCLPAPASAVPSCGCRRQDPGDLCRQKHSFVPPLNSASRSDVAGASAGRRVSCVPQSVMILSVAMSALHQSNNGFRSSADSFSHSRLQNFSYNHLTWVSRYQKGKTNLDFTGARDSEWQWHQLGHMQVCTSLQTDNHASTPPLVFYRPDALPAAQPTASKH